MITASDEPEYARRARIRLELAIGYFQRGQMEFALDEVKRSLTAYPGYSKAYNVRGLIYNQLHDQRMAEESKREGKPPEFLSTHPADSTRIRQIQQWLPEAMGYYVPRSEAAPEAASGAEREKAGEPAKDAAKEGAEKPAKRRK